VASIGLVARVSLVVLLGSSILGAQAPSASPGIRHAALRGLALVVKADGSVVGWGRDANGQTAKTVVPKPSFTTILPIELPGKALQAALGESSQYVLLEDGTVMSWGSNDEGQLGNGPMGASGQLGTYPKPSPTPVAVTGLTGVIQIAAGTKHAVALRNDGTVSARPACPASRTSGRSLPTARTTWRCAPMAASWRGD
jgi:hypothetical protein